MWEYRKDHHIEQIHGTLGQRISCFLILYSNSTFYSGSVWSPRMCLLKKWYLNWDPEINAVGQQKVVRRRLVRRERWWEKRGWDYAWGNTRSFSYRDVERKMKWQEMGQKQMSEHTDFLEHSKRLGFILKVRGNHRRHLSSNSDVFKV